MPLWHNKDHKRISVRVFLHKIPLSVKDTVVIGKLVVKVYGS